MTLTARPPVEVSLYFVDMSSPVWRIVSITVSSETRCTPSPFSAMRAAFTAVDRAEAEVEEANVVNALAPGIVAQAARAVRARTVHLSTDYVFDGTATRPYRPGDLPSPQSVYGRFATFIDDRIRSVETVDGLKSYANWVSDRLYNPTGLYPLIIRGMLQHFDLPEIENYGVR